MARTGPGAQQTQEFSGFPAPRSVCQAPDLGGTHWFLLVRGTVEEVVSEDANRFLDSLELPSHPQAR